MKCSLFPLEKRHNYKYNNNNKACDKIIRNILRFWGWEIVECKEWPLTLTFYKKMHEWKVPLCASVKDLFSQGYHQELSLLTIFRSLGYTKTFIQKKPRKKTSDYDVVDWTINNDESSRFWQKQSKSRITLCCIFNEDKKARNLTHILLTCQTRPLYNLHL